jgi:hypothetical protein
MFLYEVSCLHIIKQCSGRVQVEKSGSKRYNRNGAYLRRTYQVCYYSIQALKTTKDNCIMIC